MDQTRGKNDKLFLTVLNAELFELPEFNQVNLFLRMYLGTTEEYESEPQWESGPSARFNSDSYNLGDGNEESLEIEVWTKESEYRGVIQDMYLGSCVMTLD